MRSIIILLFGLLSLLPQSVGIIYPPEGQPIIPSIQVLWMTLPVPDVVNPVLDASQIIDKLIAVTFTDYPTQALADAFCMSVIANDNLVLAGDPSNIARNRLDGCIRVDYTAVSDGVDFNWGQTNLEKYKIQYNADIDQFYTNSNQSCGLGFQDSWQYGVKWGHSWVDRPCAISNFSNIHEQGHNMGANHDPPNAGNSIFPWARGFCDSAHARRDVMTYPNPCGGNRGPFFSNPNISPYGSPFGDALTMDNARAIRQAGPIIAGFRNLSTIVNHQRD
jgi:hypothetical protein